MEYLRNLELPKLIFTEAPPLLDQQLNTTGEGIRIGGKVKTSS